MLLYLLSVVTSVFIFIIHFRVLYTLAYCIMIIAKGLFVKEQLLFIVMNN